MKKTIRRKIAMLSAAATCGSMLLNFSGGLFSNMNWNLTANAADEDVAINDTNFPDDNFRSYVASEIDTSGDGVLSEEEIAAVTFMDVSKKEIADMTGVAYFTALETLRCSSNQLQSLDLSSNLALRSFYCDNNFLTSLDVSCNTALEHLSCSNNQLQSLDLSNNLALWSLSCDKNFLTSLDVSNHPTLLSFSCGSNQLTSLNVSGCKTMYYMFCAYNQLTSLDLSNTPALEELYCNSNQLTELDVNACSILQWINCNSNQLTRLLVNECEHLENLKCSDNHLTSLNMNKMTSMCELESNGNQYEISLTGNTFDLNTLPEGFDISRAVVWSNATVKGNILTIADPAQNVEYIYDYGNSQASEFRLIPVSAKLTEDMVSDIAAQTYTGDTIHPEIAVSFGKKVLTEGEDYTVSYEDNVNAGTAKAIITATGAFYTGEVIAEFEISKAEPLVTPIVKNTELHAGDALPEITCESEISGTIKWLTKITDGLAEGENLLEWTFTPDDTDNYEIVTGTMTVAAQTEATTATTTTTTTDERNSGTATTTTATTDAANSEIETTTTTAAEADNDGSEENLPQTGYSAAYQYIIPAAAAMVLFGTFAVAKSRKKEQDAE